MVLSIAIFVQFMLSQCLLVLKLELLIKDYFYYSERYNMLAT